MSTKLVVNPTFPLNLGEPGRGRNLTTLIRAPRIDEGQGEALVAVWTSRHYKRGVGGAINSYGPVREIISGTWAHGLAGNTASGKDALFAVKPGAVILARGGDNVVVYGWCPIGGDTWKTLRTDRAEENLQKSLDDLREIVACLDAAGATNPNGRARVLLARAEALG